MRNLSIFLRRGQNRTGSGLDWEGYKTQDSLQTTVCKLVSPREIKTVTRSCRLHLFDGGEHSLLPTSRGYRFAVEASCDSTRGRHTLHYSAAPIILLRPSAGPDTVHEYGSQLKWSGWKSPLRHWERGVPHINHCISNSLTDVFCMNPTSLPKLFPYTDLIITPIYRYYQKTEVPHFNYFVPKTSVPPTAH